MSATTWITAGVILAGVTGLFTLFRTRNRRDDKGAVSDQWVSQHRADQTYDR